MSWQPNAFIHADRLCILPKQAWRKGVWFDTNTNTQSREQASWQTCSGPLSERLRSNAQQMLEIFGGFFCSASHLVFSFSATQQPKGEKKKTSPIGSFVCSWRSLRSLKAHFMGVCAKQVTSAVIMSIIPLFVLQLMPRRSGADISLTHLPALHLPERIWVWIFMMHFSLVSFDPSGRWCAKTSRQMWRTDSCNSSTSWLSSCEVTFRFFNDLQTKRSISARYLLCYHSGKSAFIRGFFF